MMKSILVSALAASALLVGCGRGGNRLERMSQVVSWRLDDALDELDATDAQRAQLSGIKDRLMAEAPALMEGSQRARDELFAQWNSPRPDAARVHAVIDERLAAIKGVAHKVADALIEAHGILTPEQRKQVASHLERRRK